MYGRFEYFGVADLDREMTEASLTEAATRFELVYQTGGTGGPYPSLDKAKQYAERLLKGGKDRWIAVIDTKQVNDLKRAKVLWLLKRDGGWEKGPRPMPNVPPTTQYNEDLGDLDEARGTQTISMAQMMDLKNNPKARQMAIRGAAGGPFAGFEAKTFPSREKMIEFLKKQAKRPSHGALHARDWKAVVKDKVGKPGMIAYPSYQQESLDEARSKAVKGKPGKYRYKGKVGVWRTLENGDRVFFPDDKSGPMAMRGPTKAKSKKPGLLKRIGGAIKRAFTREEIEAELAALEASSSPFPEVRERRIAELRAELEEAKKVPPRVLGRLGGDGRGRGLGRGRPGRGLGVGKPEGGRGLGPGKGKGPFRGTGMGPGTGTCENLRAQVDEAVAKGKHRPRKWLHITPSMFKGGEKQESADAAGDLLTERKQPLLTGAIRKKLPPIYSQENEKDPMVHLKLFSPYMRMGYFLITEFDGEDTMFGAANTGHGWELGYMSLQEMENAKGPGGVQAIERDMYFKPKKLSAAKADISRSRGEN